MEPSWGAGRGPGAWGGRKGGQLRIFSFSEKRSFKYPCLRRRKPRCLWKLVSSAGTLHRCGCSVLSLRDRHTLLNFTSFQGVTWASFWNPFSWKPNKRITDSKRGQTQTQPSGLEILVFTLISQRLISMKTSLYYLLFSVESQLLDVTWKQGYGSLKTSQRFISLKTMQTTSLAVSWGKMGSPSSLWPPWGLLSSPVFLSSLASFVLGVRRGLCAQPGKYSYAGLGMGFPLSLNMPSIEWKPPV